MISAKIVADSLSPQGHRLTTLEVVMPRYILAEFNTHRVLSKNSASSRAIPFSKMVKSVEENSFIPYAWQKDHKGMQGIEYIINSDDLWEAKALWLRARDKAVIEATKLNNLGVTKQLCNRLLEPFMYHKVLVSGTEWENFFNLRCPQYTTGYKLGSPEAKFEKHHRSWKDVVSYLEADSGLGTGDIQVLKERTILQKLEVNKGQADIHMMFLAEAIYDAIQESTPKQLEEGQWHIPYGDNFDIGLINLACLNKYGISTEHGKELAPDVMKQKIEEAKIQISVARCARLSYQTLGDNPVIDYEKDLALYETLSTSGHYSPFEHVARVMTEEEYSNNYICSTSNKSRWSKEEGKYKYADLGWCRNFRGFIQQRTLLD